MEKPVINIGAVLRDQREKLGYSLKEASQYTRIRKTFLESLENNEFEDLPGHVYVVGFIKVYALYLDLDSDSLVAALEEPEGRDVPPSLESVPIIRSQSRHSGKHNKGGWRAFTIGLLVVLILGGLVYLLQPVFQTKALDTAVSNEVVTKPGAIATETSAPAPAATEQRPKPVLVKAAESATKTEQTVVTTAAEEEPVPVAVVVKKPPLAVEEKTPQSKLPPVPPQGSSLRMLALAESSLIIYVDNRKPQQYTLHDGLDLTWKIKASVKIELAGPDVARFWLGGLELDLDELKSFQLQPAD